MFSTARDRIDNREPMRAARRRNSTRQREHDGDAHPPCDNRQRQRGTGKAERLGHRKDQGRCTQAQQSGEHAKHQRFDEHQRSHCGIGKADGLENGELRNACSHRLHHGIPSEEQQCEKHGAHDRIRATLAVTPPGVRLDSQAKYAVLAEGGAEIYLRMPTSADYRENIWDHAAGALIVEEAGGRVSDVHGAPLDFTRGRKLLGNQGVVASNGRVHDAFLAAIRTVGGLPS